MINLRRDVSFKASIARNWLIQIFWWVIFYPGFFSGDSFSAVDIARTGDLTNDFTTSWAIYVRVFSFHGHFIGLLTLVNGLVLVYAITRFAYSIFRLKNAAVASFILTSTPLVWGMGITLWHDILMTSGLLLVTATITKMISESLRLMSWQIFDLFLGSMLVTFRPNGLPTLLIFIFIFSFHLRKYSKIRFLAFSALLGTLFFCLPSYLVLNKPPINKYFAQEWMRNDISCYLSTNKESAFLENHLSGLGTVEQWQSKDACEFLNKYKLSRELGELSVNNIPKAWKELFKQKPWQVINTHLNRNAYLIPIPFTGIPNPPFIHSNIEVANQGINWMYPSIAEKVRTVVRVWNYFRPIFSWAGLWLLIASIISYIRRQYLNLPFLICSLTLCIILFIFAPIPDGRYVLYTLIGSQMIFINEIFMVIAKSRKSHKDI
jgi:hypothetical protein